jgi:hypothetical protein
MADFYVYQKLFPHKQGDPITNATFTQVITPALFKPSKLLPLPVLPPGGPQGNRYQVFLQIGPPGTVRVTAPGRGYEDHDIYNGSTITALI